MKSILCAAALALGIAVVPQVEAQAQSTWGDRVGQAQNGRVVRQSDKRVESRRSTGSYWGDRVAQVSGRRVVVRQPGRVVTRPDYREYRGYRDSRIIEVDRIHNPGRWFKRHRNARLVTVWYDRDRAIYYNAYRPGTREIRIYRVNGRYFDRHPANYYRNNNRWDRDNRHDRDRYDDRYDRDRNRRNRDGRDRDRDRDDDWRDDD